MPSASDRNRNMICESTRMPIWICREANEGLDPEDRSEGEGT